MIPQQISLRQSTASRGSWKDIMDYIKEKWDKDYYITDFVYGNGQYCVVMCYSSDWDGQAIRTGKTFPKEKVDELWNKDYHITSVAHDGEDWIVVMTGGNTGLNAQSWFTRTKWDDFKSEIQKGWNDGYDITCVSYGNGTYCGVMSKNLNWSQSWNFISGEITNKEMDNMYPDEKIITDLMDANGGLFLVRSGRTPYDDQGLFKSSSWEPLNKKMTEYWDKGYVITSFCFYRGEWYMLMSK
ncbi:MAG: hypothetical protein IJ776_02160 [Paludibacteraceae bacterium]|nr:hypothetical protein [Paludibacteraceae bacterium]